MRAQESGHGFHMHRNDWGAAELAEKLALCVGDKALAERLKNTSAYMRSRNGQQDAARILDGVLKNA
ncbi:hypothetical protein D3C71_2155150 [compost metagenome]